MLDRRGNIGIDDRYLLGRGKWQVATWDYPSRKDTYLLLIFFGVQNDASNCYLLTFLLLPATVASAYRQAVSSRHDASFSPIDHIRKTSAPLSAETLLEKDTTASDPEDSIFSVATRRSMAFFLRARRAIFIALLLCMVNVVRASSSSDGARASGRHEIVEEKVMYSRWRSVIQRKVRTPDGKIIDYDVSVWAHALFDGLIHDDVKASPLCAERRRSSRTSDSRPERVGCSHYLCMGHEIKDSNGCARIQSRVSPHPRWVGSRHRRDVPNEAWGGSASGR